jgi:hypothetical protein
MNCQQCREELVAYLEGLLDPRTQEQIASHVAECPACQAEFQDVLQLTVRLARDGLSAPPVALQNPVIDRILQEQARAIRRLRLRRRLRIVGIAGTLAVAAALLLAMGMIFTLRLPKNVGFFKEPKPLADNAKYEPMTPQQAARAFFEACSKRDWNEAQKFMATPVDESFKQHLGGLEIISIGKPFLSLVSLLNGDWFVPYEIKTASGDVRKWNLALRKYPAAKRFFVDGGI